MSLRPFAREATGHALAKAIVALKGKPSRSVTYHEMRVAMSLEAAGEHERRESGVRLTPRDFFWQTAEETARSPVLVEIIIQIEPDDWQT